MKKITILFMCLTFLTGIGHTQSEDYKNNFSLGLGFTTLGLIKTAVDGSLIGQANLTSVPNIEIAYDKGLTDWFSIGIIGTYQSLSISETYQGFQNKFTVARTVIAASFMFHYANKGKMDLYSGFRIGYKNWTVEESFEDANSTYDSGLEALSVFGTGLSPQLTLFGLRGYLTDNIGIGMDVLCIGAPHISSLNLNYRF